MSLADKENLSRQKLVTDLTALQEVSISQKLLVWMLVILALAILALTVTATCICYVTYCRSLPYQPPCSGLGLLETILLKVDIEEMEPLDG